MKGIGNGLSADRTFEKVLAACSPHDFDGHSDFDKLTPEQRLDWLDDLVDFVATHKGARTSPARRRRPTR